MSVESVLSPAEGSVQPAGAPLWSPIRGDRVASRLFAFARFAVRFGAPDCLRSGGHVDYAALHSWSVERPERFWAALWEFSGVIADGGPGTGGGPVAVGLDRMAPPDPVAGPRWFPGARLNYAENLLRAPGDRVALSAWTETGRARTLTYAELEEEVGAFARGLLHAGVGPGDRVAAVLPNGPEAVIGMLGAATIGAIWSSCSPDFGVGAVVDRFGQIEPRVLLVTEGYRYGGKEIGTLPRAREIAARLPSVERVVVAPASGSPAPAPGVFTRSAPEDAGGPAWVAWADFLVGSGPPPYVRLPFDHPLAILYSSGTTGLPKCMVHGAGGTLLQHLKELTLHVDLRPADRFLYFTTCGWMMWNWLVSGLALGAALVLYDGAPHAPSPRLEGRAEPSGAPDILWTIADAERLAVFGASARYFALMEKQRVRPRESHRLPALRTVLSTGSPLAAHGFEYIYRDVAADVHLASISGGTDIVSCFVLGIPTEPVRAGEIQGPGLGMAVEVRSPEGVPLPPGEPGELVCTRPFPSMPLGFWNDPDGARYRAAYFESIPGVWRHGDWTERTPGGGFVIHGRSDATLNPGGVRIGTAEIYRQVETLPEVVESVAVGEEGTGGDVRIVLFVRLREGLDLDASLEQRIRQTIRENASPHHVPRRIVQVPDLPRTISGKVSEIAVREAIHGRPVANRDALANPEALEHFSGMAPLRPAGQGAGAMLARLVDYAGLFPPAALPMREAAARYAEYRRSPDGWMLGRFVVPAGRMSELAEHIPAGGDPWPLSVLVADEASGPAALPGATGHFRVEALELRATSAAEIERIAERFDGSVERYVEIPLEPDPRPLVRALAAHGLLAKARTGGVTEAAFPDPDALLAFLVACVAEDLPFKATAGLHHPLRGTYPLTYEPESARGVMYGYLNLLLATALLRAGESTATARMALLESDAAAIRIDQRGLAWRGREIESSTLRTLRERAMTSFGSCSFREPVDEIAGILHEPVRPTT